MSNVGAEDLSDEELLERFTSRQDEAAFGVLMRRYGRLVLSVCRRVLGHEQDAEDAVQVVFCVLARRAGSIRKRGAVGAWLHAVASGVARKAQAKGRRRPVSTANLPDMPAKDSPEWTWSEVRPILDEEVNRLPEKYRQAFVLCCLDCRTNEQAAAQVGCPPGTILSRLARAREQLRRRLRRRGLALSLGALTGALTREAAAADVPPRLTTAAFRAAVASAGGGPAADAPAPSVAALTVEYLQSPSEASRPRGRWIRVAVASIAVTLLGLVFLLLRPLIAGPGKVAPAPPAPNVQQRVAGAGKVAPAPPAPNDEQRIQGTWAASRVETGGIGIPPNGLRLTFAGDQFTLLGDNFGLRITARFRLDATRNPREITLLPERGGESPGIYQFDGNSLKICINQNGPKRPREFTTAGQEGVFLYVVAREPASP
jgi:RNA polymerase sigma factor (sigma-70 family)